MAEVNRASQSGHFNEVLEVRGKAPPLIDHSSLVLPEEPQPRYAQPASQSSIDTSKACLMQAARCPPISGLSDSLPKSIPWQSFSPASYESREVQPHLANSVLPYIERQQGQEESGDLHPCMQVISLGSTGEKIMVPQVGQQLWPLLPCQGSATKSERKYV